MTTLYQLAHDGIEVEMLLLESVGEITPDIQEKMDALLESGPDKLEAAAAVVRQLQASAKIAEEESDRLRERSKQFEDQAQKLKERMTFALDKAFGGKIKTPKWTIYTKKNADQLIADLLPGITPQMLHEERPDLVRVKYEFDRVRTRELYKDPETRKQLPDLILFEEKEGTRCTIIR